MNPVREVFGGFGVLLRGLAIVVRRPRLFLLGALPALVTSLLFLAALVTLAVNLADLVAWATPFAREWDTVWQGLLRGALSVAVLAGAVLVMVVTFTTVTLGLGAPVYDRIAELVEEGYDPDSTRIHAPSEYTLEGAAGDHHTVGNYTGQDYGEVSARQATIDSVNTAYVQLKHQTILLAAWQTHLELVFAALHGDVRCPWPAERTEALRAHYAATLA